MIHFTYLAKQKQLISICKSNAKSIHFVINITLLIKILSLKMQEYRYFSKVINISIFFRTLLFAYGYSILTYQGKRMQQLIVLPRHMQARAIRNSREEANSMSYRPIIYYRSWSLLFRRDFVNKRRRFHACLSATNLHQDRRLPTSVERPQRGQPMLLSLRATRRAFSSLKTVVNASVAIRTFENTALSVRTE